MALVKECSLDAQRWQLEAQLESRSYFSLWERELSAPFDGITFRMVREDDEALSPVASRTTGLRERTGWRTTRRIMSKGGEESNGG